MARQREYASVAGRPNEQETVRARAMNPYLDDDLRTLAEHARRFATERIAPGFQERDRTRVLDRGLMREMGALEV